MGGEGNSRITTGVALALAGAVAGALLGTTRPTPRLSVEAPSPTVEASETGSIEVHVAGWVVAPGVVVLEEGAIVADAVTAAGGMRPGARADLLNLAAPIGAGEQVVVPGPHAGEPTGAQREAGPMSLNRADAEELQGLPGVGPVLAERIVAHRESVGGFERVEDLLQVPGIGEAKLAALRDLVRVP